MLTLTPGLLKAAYEMLLRTEPFKHWTMPAADDIDFVVTSDRGNAGWYDDETGTLAVSGACHSYLPSMLMTLAHEMVHAHQSILGQPMTHGPRFKKLAALVCSAHGFDPKEFMGGK